MKKNHFREPHSLALNRISGEFIDKAMELDFLKTEWKERQRQLRISMSIAGPAYFLGIIGDYLILGPIAGFWIVALLRSLQLAGAASVFFLTSAKNRISALNLSILITELIIASSETTQLCYESRELAEGFLMVGLVFVLFVPNRLFLTMFATVFMSISCIATLFMVNLPSYHLSWIIIFAILFNLLSFNILRSRNQLQRRAYASRKQILQAAQETAEANEKLRVSEERFRDFVIGVPIGIFRATIDGLIVEANPAILKIIGFDTLDEVNQYGLFNLFDNPEERLQLVRTVLLEPVTGYGLTLRKPSGQSLSIRIHARIVRDGKGEPIFMDGALEDITDQKRAEQMIRESERRLADIISFLPIATFVIDREGRVTAWNRAMEIISGVSASAIIGKGDHEYSIPFYGERRDILIDLVFAGEKELCDRYMNIHRENGILSAEAFMPAMGEGGVIIEGYAGALRDTDGIIVGAIESVRDITSIRKTEMELRDARNIAENANRSKSIFLANMSHEIRTPMNAILGYTQLMLRDRTVEGQLKEYLDIINRSGEHLLSLINDILEMSKIEAGRSVLVPKNFDLNRLVDDVEKMFRVQAEGKKLRLIVERVVEMPQWLNADEGKLRQILVNLMGNAMKFTVEGGIALRVWARKKDGNNMDLLIEVEDTGPGIAVADMDRLFNLFEQTSSGVRSGGTGLGLALSRGFVELMGGELTVSSVVGKGSVFSLAIPAKEGKEVNVEKAEDRRRVLGLDDKYKGMRLLIADDLDTNRRLLTKMLANMGFDIREVVNGIETVKIFHEWQPRIILMDMSMPVMDGYEATRRIKADAKGKNTAIVAVTASAFEEHRQVMLSAGINGYLAKPFREEDLFTVIKEVTGADYVYEDEIPEIDDGESESVNMEEFIMQLSPLLVREMREATVSADLGRLKQLIMEAGRVSLPASKKLTGMAVRYEYDALLDLLSRGNEI